MNRYKFLLFAMVFFSIICLGFGLIVAETSNETSASGVVNFSIEPEVEHQIIDNFGASDAWSLQAIGQWPEQKQKQMATWLFSTETDKSGNPKGIGLSLWRFYIGAGSNEQGEKSMIREPLRRSECFLLPDGTYDWNKQSGQRNFMKLAKNQGVSQFLGFVYSAPVYWTQNGLATNFGRNGTFNIKEDKYDDFARFVADVVEGVERKDGIRFNYIAPFNEPDGHWNWNETKQEGTAATKYEIAQTVKELNDEFKKRNLPTQIIAPESSNYLCLYDIEPNTKYDRGFQIQSYFLPDSSNSYIGNLTNVPKLIAGHSYWTNTPVERMRDIRIKLDKTIKNTGVKFWQTELCVMGNDTEIGGGGKKDLTMRTALYIARVIHHDLVYANASAWHWWLAVSTADYKDGLIYAKPDSSLKDGNFTDSKLLWSLGNYSRFIRPGAKRIGVSALSNNGRVIPEGDTDPNGIMLSAYQNMDKSVVAVVINYSNQDKQIKVGVKNNDQSIWQTYITSDKEGFNLKRQFEFKNGQEIIIPAQSIVTCYSGE